MATDREVNETAHRSFIESWRQDSDIVLENNGLLYYSTPLNRYVGHSGLFRTDPSITASETTSAANEFAVMFGRRVVLPCRPGVDDDLIAAAEQAGFVHAETYFVMVKHSPHYEELPSGIEILTVDDKPRLDRFREVMVNAWNFAMDDTDLRMFFTRERIVERDNLAAVLVSSKGEDVAGALTVINLDLGGVFWVGTKRTKRTRGFGSLAAIAATNIAFRLGAHSAVLQTTEEVMPLYQNLGFNEILSYQLWVTSGVQQIPQANPVVD